MKQSIDGKEVTFDKLGIVFNKAYTDKISGKNIDTPALNKLELEVT